MITYKHEPFTDFSKEENIQAFRAGLQEVEANLGKDYPLVIDGERVTTDEKIISVNPANKEEIVGRVSKADQGLAEKAMRSALDAFETWKKVKPA